MCACLIAANSIFFSLIAYKHNAYFDSEKHALEQRRASLEQQLNTLYNQTLGQFDTLSRIIIESGAQEGVIYSHLVDLVDAADGIIRFGWSNSDKALSVSSARGIHTPPIDLSHRTYIHNAAANPNQFFFTNTLNHVFVDVPFKALHKGLTNTEGRYLGTLSALVYLQPLQQLANTIFTDYHCNFSVIFPSGELLASSNTSPSQETIFTIEDNSTFKIQAQLLPRVHLDIFNEYTLPQITLLFFFNMAALALYLLIRHRILRPVSQALAVMIPSAAAQAGRPPIIEEPLGQLSKLAEHYQEMRTQLAEKEALIANFAEVMQQLQSQQQRFLQASGSEMGGMFQAVRGYASHLEECILQQKLDPDAAYDFDDVREMGDNLQHLSQCFLAFTQTDTAKVEAADPDRILRQTLLQLEPMIERRNLTLQLERGRDVWVMQPAAQSWVSALHRAMLYAAIRYAEDESHLQLWQKSEGETLEIRFEVSRFKQSTLPPEDQDFGMFMPSLRQDMTSTIERLFEHHANIMLAEAISTKLHGQFTLDVSAPKQGFTFIVTLPHQPPKA